MAFPSLVPTSRSLTYGEYPVKQFRSQSGAVTRRLLGDRPGNFKLSLQFQGLSPEGLDSIWSHYTSMQGMFTGFTLPDELWAGEDATLRTRYQSFEYVLWHYEGPPQAEAVRGTTRRNVTVALTGDLIGG